MDKQCQRVGGGFTSLCGVWQDPAFDPRQPAFYYVRVLENPVCRYSTLMCQKNYGINPLEPLEVCQEQLANASPRVQTEAAMCCSNETTNPIVQPIIQERAWISPIWYKPATWYRP